MVLPKDIVRPKPARDDCSVVVDVAGRADSGRTRALHAQWERRDRPSFSEAPRVLSSCPEIPRVSSGFPEMPSLSHTSSERSSISISGGVKTLGLDINSFVPVGTTGASLLLVSVTYFDYPLLSLIWMHSVPIITTWVFPVPCGFVSNEDKQVSDH
jgi:hypothetical protein